MVGQGQTQRVDQERQAIIAEHFSFSQLPGSMRKHIRLSPVESALVLENWRPAKVVGPGKQAIGWWLFGGDKPHIHVARFYREDFTLHLSLSVQSGDAIALTALLTAIVRIGDVAACWRAILSMRPSSTAQDIDDTLSASQEIQRLIGSECSAYQADLLIHDPQLASQIATRLSEPLAGILWQRGLRLIQISHLGLQRGKASEQVKKRLEDWEDIINATESAENVEDTLIEIEKRRILKDSEFEQFKKAVQEAGGTKEALRAHLRELAELQHRYEKERLELLLRSDLEHRRQAEEAKAQQGSADQVPIQQAPTFQQATRREQIESVQAIVQYCAVCNRPISAGQTYFYCLKCGKGPLCNNDYFGNKGCAFCSKRKK